MTASIIQFSKDGIITSNTGSLSICGYTGIVGHVASRSESRSLDFDVLRDTEYPC